MTSGIPEYLMAVAACSREEPVPKLYPEMRMVPGLVVVVTLVEEEDDDEDCWEARNEAAVAAKVGS